MDLSNRSVVITGGGNGIGRALADGFAAAGARGIVVADLNVAWAELAAEQLRAAGTPAIGIGCDVSDPDQINRMINEAEEAFEHIDVLCSNAGYSDGGHGVLYPDTTPDAWRHIVDVNLLSHVWAAQRVLPGMIERGSGYFLHTISSAALITGPSGPGYTLSKHGALGFAEWLAINHRHLGIRVSCLCPNAVYTGMFGRDPERPDTGPSPETAVLGDMLAPEAVASVTLDAVTSDEPFLILPHERVLRSFQRKATDYDAWIGHTNQRLVRLREDA